MQTISDDRILKARMVAIVDVISREVSNDMVIGIGSGSTIEMLLKELGKFVNERGLNIITVPSSYRSHMLAIAEGLKTASLYEYSSLDLTIDSFDESDEENNVIKGGGAALTREKIIAQAAKRVVYVADYAKMKKILSMPVPIEVLPFALPYVKNAVKRLGGELKLRHGTGKFGPIFSDNGNMIADADFGELKDPLKLEIELKRIAGVVESGIFAKVCHMTYVGQQDGTVRRIEWK
ncbi:MAG: ribose 5-phosphate isomerase A [Nitrososphaerota archaeon]|nr:ribose 5-phosphate isomerase A [Aigarchaeota archaeon]MDW8076638.1 ribose 5-phosphate isomerase A [Nitrososphaerota archaeon]